MLKQKEKYDILYKVIVKSLKIPFKELRKNKM